MHRRKLLSINGLLFYPPFRFCMKGNNVNINEPRPHTSNSLLMIIPRRLSVRLSVFLSLPFSLSSQVFICNILSLLVYQNYAIISSWLVFFPQLISLTVGINRENFQGTIAEGIHNSMH